MSSRQFFTDRDKAEIFAEGVRAGAGSRLISCDIFTRRDGYEVVFSRE